MVDRNGGVMHYHSTRSTKKKYHSAEAIIAGICDDGGLFVPDNFPQLDVASLQGETYGSIAAKVLSLFLTDFDSKFIISTVNDVYTEGRFANGAGHMKRVSERLSFVELWHGPTYAFKDYALQLLAPLLCEAKRMKGDDEESLILVATSGDTGSAALYGFADVPGTRVVVFYPNGGVSMVQQRQMEEAEGDNLAVFAVNGNFDDIQTSVKKIFNNSSMSELASKNSVKLSSANSINLGRLLPQICYYFSSYAELLEDEVVKPGEAVDYVVPTGNFGDILAGYYAKKMGLPIGKLICASNKNRILTDFFETGEYDTDREFHLTGSPSMDILVSSNLERLLYHESGDAEYVASLMKDLKSKGKFKITKKLLQKLQKTFYSASADDDQTQKIIAESEKNYKYLCDPHTAVALSAAYSWNNTGKAANQIVILSTASPFKFPAEVFNSLNNSHVNDITSINMLNSSFPWHEIPDVIMDICNPMKKNPIVIDIKEIERNIKAIIKEH